MRNQSVIPQVVKEAWENKKGPVVFTTVSAEAEPNSIYATCVSLYQEKSIIVANNYFDKTIKNIEAGSRGSILFITEDDKAYQIKGSIEHVTSGAAFDDMKSWNPERLPGVGAAIIAIEEIYCGAEKLL